MMYLRSTLHHNDLKTLDKFILANGVEGEFAISGWGTGTIYWGELLSEFLGKKSASTYLVLSNIHLYIFKKKGIRIPINDIFSAKLSNGNTLSKLDINTSYGLINYEFTENLNVDLFDFVHNNFAHNLNEVDKDEIKSSSFKNDVIHKPSNFILFNSLTDSKIDIYDISQLISERTVKTKTCKKDIVEESKRKDIGGNLSKAYMFEYLDELNTENCYSLDNPTKASACTNGIAISGYKNGHKNIFYENIIDVFYANQNTIQSYQGTKSVVGRALVGGLVLGPLGAIVGAMSGFGSKNADFLVIRFLDSCDASKESVIVLRAMDPITPDIKAINTIVNLAKPKIAGDKLINNLNAAPEDPSDPLDRIKKLKTLLDEGAISEAEFVKTKAALLNNLK